MKDLERSFDVPPGIRFRTVFNGDSFLEGMFRLEPLSEVVELNWMRAGMRDMEAINLGISATNPIHYYYRISNVVVKLHPDAMLLMFYPGNDFTSQAYSPGRSLPFVAERPEPSFLGEIAPHLTWQIVNRLGLSEIASGNTSASDEYNIMLDIMKKPRQDRAPPLAAYLRRYYLPNVGEAQIEEILSRNGGSFWEPFERKDETAEQLAGWIPASIIRFETGATKTPATAAEAERTIDPAEVESTLSWLIAAKKLAEANHIRLVIAVAPMGSVDPSYVEFWKPWPRYFGWSVRQTVERQLLLDALWRHGISAIDLAQDLDGIRGTYRLTDGHWTALGTSVVAKRVAHELIRIRNERTPDRQATAD